MICIRTIFSSNTRQRNFRFGQIQSLFSCLIDDWQTYFETEGIFDHRKLYFVNDELGDVKSIQFLLF